MNSDLQLKHRVFRKNALAWRRWRLFKRSENVLRARRPMLLQVLTIVALAAAFALGQGARGWSVFAQVSPPQDSNARRQGTAGTNSAAAAGDHPATEATPHSSAERVVYRCEFSEDADVNYDGWPDSWRRRTGPGFPHYIDARIRPDAAGDPGLNVRLNGGGFAAEGEELPVSPQMGYRFRVLVHNAGREDAAILAVRWLNAEHNVISESRSAAAMPEAEVQTVRLTVTGAPAGARYMQPVLLTEPGRLPDLAGEIQFDELEIRSAPRIDLSLERANNVPNLFRPRQPIVAHVSLGGDFAAANDLQLRVEMRDVGGNLLEAPREFPLRPAPEETPSGPPPQQPAVGNDRFQADIPAPQTRPGYYQLTATLLERGTPITSRRIAWAVVQEETRGLQLDFAWSAEDGAAPLAEDQLIALAAEAGIGWLKFPCWAEPTDDARIAELARIADQLSAQEIRMVGLLNHPPREVLAALPEGISADAAGVFSQPEESWYPAFLPTQRRIAMSVRRWQLGTDDDISFVGFRNLPLQIRQVKSALDRLGNNVELGIAWNWLHPLPTVPHSQSITPDAPWTDLSLSAIPPLTPAELARYLAATQASAQEQQARRWVNVQSLPSADYPTEIRATHLAKQMVAAKAFGADGINLPRAMSAEQGMIHEDGSPGELFLVWRTFATRLSGAEFLGTLQFPGGSQNLVFVRGGEGLMVAWNDHPTTETMYLGEVVRRTDLWGRELPLESHDGEQTFDVGPTPTIFTGLNVEVARFSMTVRLESAEVPAVFGRTFANSVIWDNPYPYPIAGQVKIPTPPGWNVTAGTGEFRLQENETATAPFYASFPYAAETGRQMMKLDFRVVADRDYRFSVYREIDLAMPDIEWDVATRIDEEGVLHVDHRLRNLGQRLHRVRAVLHAPNRQRHATPLLTIEPGMSYHEMQLYDADDLRGEMVTIRLEEPGTNRFLNKRILLER